MIVSGARAAFFDARDWSSRLSHLERQTCLIELANGRPLGTGFLVGGDLVMSAGHVFPFEPKKDSPPPPGLQVRFDYYGGTLSPDGGRKATPAEKDWLLAWTPPPKGTEQKAVDTTVFRLSEPVGLDAFNGQMETRGWVDLTASQSNLEKGSGLAIIGHPEGGPLKISMNTQAVIGYDDVTGHLMYRTDTLPGYSGAPCFDLAWEFAAIHQGRSVRQGNHNRGIPLHIIAEWLQGEGLWDEVSQKPPVSLSRAAGEVAPSAVKTAAKQFGIPDPLKQLMKEEGEGQLLEYKVSWVKAKDKTLKTIAAFLNSKGGGTLLLGVDNKGKAVGIESDYPEANVQKADWDGFSLALVNSLDRLELGGNVQQYIRLARVSEDNKTICIVSVEPSDRPVFFDNIFYQRTEAESRPIQGHRMLDYIVRRWSWLGTSRE